MRTAATAAMSALIVVGLAGCAYLTPQATLNQYDPSDGVNGTVGEVDLLNVMALSADGENVSVLGRVLNNGESTASVTIKPVKAGSTGSADVVVPSGDYIDLGKDDSELILEGVDTGVGGVLPLYVQYGDEPGVELLVPVLDGSLPEYEDLLIP
ncbi:hypothetical protein [Salinibacterium sp. ZJ454]|uniref:hypothetical protein n=1 Tax=Salinibacterium sp. ZJ454 TaxID=2708339 RepID=UPI0014245B4A|nr:hypothetical protein [Salinibacterium sp. ZJ454]